MRIGTARLLLPAFLILSAFSPARGHAQQADPSAAYPKRLPYSFGNLVWWSDDDLRAILKKRIPGLGDEIQTDSASLGRVRTVLTALLKEKGVTAEVQSEEPSYSSFGAARDPEAPLPSIEFSMLRPAVIVEKIEFEAAPEDVLPDLTSYFRGEEGKPYSAFGDWFIRSHAKEILRARGYLDGRAGIFHSGPKTDGDRFLVTQTVRIDAGAKYHVSAITVGGGRLLAGKDLSSLYEMQPGDVPGPYPLGRLIGQLQAFYKHYGYADVQVTNDIALDREHALVAYDVEVNSGSVYHLKELKIEKLNSAQELRVRELFAVKEGEAFREDAIQELYRQIADEPLLKGWSFGYSPAMDKKNAEVNLTLSFFLKDKSGDSVTIQ
jgi:hypothetical protein